MFKCDSFNLNFIEIPENLTLGGVPIASGLAAQAFGKYFHVEIESNVSRAKVKANDVYNGTNNKIELSWLNLSYNYYKIKCKEKFLY